METAKTSFTVNQRGGKTQFSTREEVKIPVQQGVPHAVIVEMHFSSIIFDRPKSATINPPNDNKEKVQFLFHKCTCLFDNIIGIPTKRKEHIKLGTFDFPVLIHQEIV